MQYIAQNMISTKTSSNKSNFSVFFSGRLIFSQVIRRPTDKNPDVFEKYLAFVSIDFSAACGLTISRPCKGVNAIDDDVPEICFRTLVLPKKIQTMNNFKKIHFTLNLK